MQLGKRLLNCIIFLMVLGIMVGLTTTASAAKTDLEGLTVQDGIVTSYTGNLSVVILPSSVDGTTIYRIGEEAFQGNTSVERVILPDTIISIGKSAFSGCINLQEISLPNGLTYIDDYTFYKCSNLEKISLPETLEKIKTWAFGYCVSLTDINFPNGLISIGPAAFYGCTSIETIVLPDSVTDLNTHCFRGCSSLSNITLSNQISKLPYRLFSGCAALTQLIIPDSVKEIEKEAFYQCGITKITGGNGVRTIGDNAFYNCMALTDLSLPILQSIGAGAFYNCNALENFDMPSLQSIGAEAFYNCKSLSSLKFAEGLTSIGERAFSGCSRLLSAVLPSTLEVIDNSAFENCAHLCELYDLSDLNITAGSENPGGVGKYALCVHKSLEEDSCLDSEGKFVFWSQENVNRLVFYTGEQLSLSLPDSYNGKPYGINSYAFYDNDELRSLEVSEGVSRLYSNALTGAGRLQTIYLPNTLETIDDHVITNVNHYRIIYDGDRSVWEQVQIGDENDLSNSTLIFSDETVYEEGDLSFWGKLKSEFSAMLNDMESNIFFYNFLLTLLWGFIFLYTTRKKDSEDRKRRRKLIFIIIVCVQWILISGLRADIVGSDTVNYLSLFDQHIRMDFSDIFGNLKEYYTSGMGEEIFVYEPGYILLEKLIGLITTSHTAYKFIIATIFTSALGFYTYKNSDDPCLSFVLYDALFYNMFSLTGYRQVVSVALVGLFGYEFVKKRKFVPFLICLLIGSMFHRTTLVFILFYFLANKRITQGYVITMAGVTGVFIAFRNQLFNYVKFLFGYEQYDGTYGFAQQTFMLMLIAFTLIAIYRYSHIVDKQNAHDESRHYYNGLILMWLMFPFAMVSPSSMRLVYDFGFVLLLLLPKIVYSFPKKNERWFVYIGMVAVLGFFIFTRSSIYQFA